MLDISDYFSMFINSDLDLINSLIWIFFFFFAITEIMDIFNSNLMGPTRPFNLDIENLIYGYHKINFWMHIIKATFWDVNESIFVNIHNSII